MTHLRIFHRYCINYYAVPHQEICELSITLSVFNATFSKAKVTGAKTHTAAHTDHLGRTVRRGETKTIFNELSEDENVLLLWI